MQNYQHEGSLHFSQSGAYQRSTGVRGQVHGRRLFQSRGHHPDQQCPVVPPPQRRPKASLVAALQKEREEQEEHAQIHYHHWLQDLCGLLCAGIHGKGQRLKKDFIKMFLLYFLS